MFIYYKFKMTIICRDLKYDIKCSHLDNVMLAKVVNIKLYELILNLG